MSSDCLGRRRPDEQGRVGVSPSATATGSRGGTDRDIVARCLAERHPGLLDEPIEHCMSTGVHTVEVDKHLATAAEKMDGEEIRRLAVVENGRLVGVLSHGNLVQAAQGRCPGERATLNLEVTRGA